jgi:hypothetical protein
MDLTDKDSRSGVGRVSVSGVGWVGSSDVWASDHSGSWISQVLSAGNGDHDGGDEEDSELKWQMIDQSKL